MEMFDMIQTMINSLGFPAVMVLYFIWDKKTCMESLTKAIENNTIVMTKLLTKLGVDDLVEDPDSEEGVIM